MYMARKKEGESKITVGNITDVSGEINIASGDIYKGFTAEQVSILIKQITTTFEPKKFDGRSPYKGLDVFEEEDVELFYGREKIIADLVNRVKESRTVFITGPSGSGKSSLVRAGLIPALKDGAIKNSGRWLYATIKPGRDPFEALKSAFSRLKSPELGNYFIQNLAKSDVLHESTETVLTERKDQRLVLFIDQFEEVFTQINKEEERVQFLNLLTNAAAVENGRLIILFSMRSDFVSNCATYPQLNALLNQQFVQIGAMQPDELVSAIAQPALRVGLKIDPDLIAQIINDMQGEPGALPLMQFALKDLFDAQQTQGGIIALTLNDYLQRGGIHKALERHADNSFNKLDQHEQELTRSIFSGLIEIGRGTQDTRRTANFDELIPTSANVEEVQAIIRKLADARLITTDELEGRDTVTISHEKLIDAWPWLKKLVNENRDVIALQNEIAENAWEWDKHERDSSYLYSGARLANAQEKINTNTIILSGTAQEFIEIAVQQEEAKRKEIEEQRQREYDKQMSLQRQRKTILWVSAALMISIGLALLTAISWLSALRQSQRALASLLSAQAVLLANSQPDLALLLSMEANHIGDELDETDPVWLGGLMATLNSIPKLYIYLRAHDSDVRALAYSPDGRWLISAGGVPTGELGEAYLWQLGTDTEAPQKLNAGDTKRFLATAFSSDNHTAVTAGDGSMLFVWDADACCDPVRQIPVDAKVRALKFVNLNGKEYLAVGAGGTVTFWDVATEQPNKLTLQLESKRSDARVLSLAFSPSGNELVAGADDGYITSWNLTTGEKNFQNCSYGDATSGQAACDVDDRTDKEIRGLAFNRDGSLLISGSSDTHAWLWDASTGNFLAKTPNKSEGGHISTVSGVSINSETGEIATVSWDNTVRLWDLEHTGDSWAFHRLDTLAGHTNSIWATAFSPDGERLVSASSDKTIIVWGVNQINQMGTPVGQMSGDVWGLAVSSNGKQFAAGDAGGNIKVWSFDGDNLTDVVSMHHPEGVLALTYSHGDQLLVSAGYDGAIIAWDVKTGIEAWRIDDAHTDEIWALAFTPDDKMLASASNDKTAKLWDTSTRKLISTMNHDDGVFTLTFNEDASRLLVTGYDFKIHDWNVTDPAKPAEGYPLTDEVGLNLGMEAFNFRPSGDWLASATNDDTIQLWQLNNPQQCATQWNLYDCKLSRFGSPLVGHRAPVENVLFLTDFDMISSSQDGQLILWDFDKAHWYASACDIARRRLDPAEYNQYISKIFDTWYLKLLVWLHGNNDPPDCIYN